MIRTTRALIIIAILLVLAVLGTWGYLHFFSNNTAKEITQNEIKDVLEGVGKHILLPEGETPTVATVTDPEPIKDQPFFSHAQVGDKVLIYPTARKAFLYRPSLDKLIEVSAIAASVAPSN